MEVCKAVLGEFNPYTAKMMGNLGDTYQKMGKPAQAEEMLKASMKILKAIRGPEDGGAEKLEKEKNIKAADKKMDYKEMVEFVKRT